MEYLGFYRDRHIHLMELASRNFSKRFINGLAKCIKRDSPFSFAEKREWRASKDRGHRLFDPGLGGGYAVFDERPLSAEIQKYCVQDVMHMPVLRESSIGQSYATHGGGKLRQRQVLASDSRKPKISMVREGIWLRLRQAGSTGDLVRRKGAHAPRPLPAGIHWFLRQPSLQAIPGSIAVELRNTRSIYPRSSKD